jgi:hypothetical protein
MMLKSKWRWGAIPAPVLMPSIRLPTGTPENLVSGVPPFHNFSRRKHPADCHAHLYRDKRNISSNIVKAEAAICAFNRYSKHRVAYKRYGGKRMRLNIGCGNLRKEGFVNIDKDINSTADVIADFDELELDSAVEIYGRMSLHHFPNPARTLSKCASLAKKVRFEQEPVRGVLIPERLCYYFSPFRHLKDNPEEKAPTLIQWSKWFRESGLRPRISMMPIRGFRGILLECFVFWLGSPRYPFYCHSAELEVVQ